MIDDYKKSGRPSFTGHHLQDKVEPILVSKILITCGPFIKSLNLYIPFKDGLLHCSNLTHYAIKCIIDNR